MPCPIFHSVVDPLYSALFTIDSTGAIRSVGASALLVAVAEMGDKSHLKSVMGEPKGADVAGHAGKMHW